MTFLPAPGGLSRQEMPDETEEKGGASISPCILF